MSEQETLEKIRFFHQYHEQNVLCQHNSLFNLAVKDHNFSDDLNQNYLGLKSLHFVTEEHAKELSLTLINVVGLDGVIRKQNAELVKEVFDNYSQIDLLGMLPSSFVDKVREFGYAFDWNGMKVSELIDKGWIKLT